jgi:type IV secretion/conjugal transfer VirB4 family ATPase
MDLVSLALGTLGGVAGVRGLAHVREHRVAPAGLADLVNWAFLVDDGVVLQKDGSLLAGWRYHGPDLSAATPAELDGLSRHVNDALLPFTDDWMFHVDAIRRPAEAYTPSCFPDPIAQVIDDERRAAYAAQASRQFETAYVLVATHRPPPDVFSRAAAFFVKGAGGARVEWGRVLEAFGTELRVLEQRLAGRLQLARLDADALLTHLHECLTGLAHPVRTPPHGSYLNVVLADQELVGGFEPRVGRMAIRAVAVQGYPHASHAGQGDFLNALPFAFRWSHRVLPLGTAQAAQQIRRHQLQWFKKRKGAAAWVQEMVGGKRDAAPRADDELWLDQDARHLAQDASAAAAENASGAVRFCYFTQVAIVMDPDPARADLVAGEILKVLNDAGFPGRSETVNALEAYLGSLPGHGYPNLRRPLLSTRNIADLLPVTSVWPGLPTNPSPFFPPQSPPLLWAATDGSTPFRVHLHDSDVGHTLVLGKTGSGKSVLLALLAAQFRRYPGAQVFAFDVGYSQWALAHAAGARHYDLAAGRVDALAFQPLARIDDPAERAWAADWVETLVGLQGVTVTPPLRGRIDRALALVARNEPPHRTLIELTVQLQDENLAVALRPYTVAGHYGQLLDASADDLADGRFQVFEMKHLLALDDRIALPVLLYLFRRIEQQLDGSPTLLLIDEAWMALMHSLFGARVNQWLLQLRKQNAAVVLATQSPAQLAQLAHRHTIVDSCVTKIYLPNPDAGTPAQAPLYHDLGLNAREIAIIARATPKRHYYLKSPRGSRLFELGLGPVALSFLAADPGASMEETRRHLETLITTHRGDWPAARLEERGLGPWAERLRTHPTPQGDASDDTSLALSTVD